MRAVTMADVHVAEELRSTGMLPEGSLERRLVADGARVRAGEPVAAVRVGEALDDIVTPTGGRLTVPAPANAMIDPGCVIAEVQA